jgi:hypothetical protein
MIEQSYKPKDSQDYVTQTISITPEQAQGIIFGLRKSVEQSMEKLANKPGNGSHVQRRRKKLAPGGCRETGSPFSLRY